ncbi:glycine cleavage system H protein [Thiothrix eikelboomii]|uniref:Glycine cleavage system H protein n=1 Tax=Thiothrix eikelboomii TaxID=92487 RepID=A0A1T4XKR3_9GAMM|nr:glycine cleavage system protein GcvH [Thiothrix eikelboomii]SKA90094.1 glycine cleavage system H protein [Thiothrix eikelboomii]
MSNVPANLKYADSHEWILDHGDGTVTIGITDHAQALLGDLVFVELPEIGSILSAGDECGVVESVKAASDIYAPIGGEVFEVNHELDDSPELVNTDPYEAGWIFKLKLENSSDLAALLSADAYGELVASEA